jgi:hypothetical protein
MTAAGRCNLCAILLLEMARAGGDPRLRAIYDTYTSGGGNPEQLLDEAVRTAGPAVLTRAKETAARKGIIPAEALSVNAGPEVYRSLSKT